MRQKVKQDRKYMYKRNIEARWRNRFCRAKRLNITCPQCVSIALLIQHSKRMRRIILSPVTIFRKKNWTLKLCFDFRDNFFLKYFSFWEEIIQMLWTYRGLNGNYPLFLSDFNETWIFSTDFRKILKFQILGIPECSMQTDRQTDRYDETNSRFS